MDYQSRLKKLKESLPGLACDALLIEYPVDLLYLTGFELSAGKLLVTKDTTTLFVDGRYIEQCRHNSPCDVKLFDESLLIQCLASHQTVGFDSTHTTYQDARYLQKKLSGITLQPIEHPVQKLRMLKDAEEIAMMRQAARLNVEGFEYVCSLLREGISEAEVALELEIFWKRRGGRKVSFDPIIAFGANSSMPHYRAGNTRLEKGMVVLLDTGVSLNHYQSDMTRVIFFGTPHPKLQEIYDIVHTAKEKAFALCHPGTTVAQLDAAARDYITERGYGECFTHSLGHGIGLETHEPPILRSRAPYGEQVLQPGLVITIEPGIYLPGLGGVRLEDTIVITDKGYNVLMNPSS